MQTSSMEEILGEAETEEGNTKEGSICPYCYTRYAANPRKCQHLLCDLFYVESNNVFSAAPNSSIVANLFGVEVPRVVAMRFIRILREKRPPDIGYASTGTLTTIKYSTETRDEFCEWTYFLVENPARCMAGFVDFVSKTYCDPAIPRCRMPFSQLQFRNGVIVLNTGYTAEPEQQLGWIMITGLPDNLPVFLYPVEANEDVMYIGRSDNLLQRIDTWADCPDTCVVSHLETLPTYLVN